MSVDASSPGREAARVPAWLLGALLGLIALGAARARWTAPQSVDNRTYLEMIDGISRHGLPYTTNGPVERYRGLQARWNNYSHGRLWGALPPVFPYAATPLYLVGGTRAVVRANVLLLGVLALLVARLTRRLTGDARAGAAAAWLSLAATPLATVAFDTSPYALMITAIVGGVDFAVAALARPAPARREALAAGLCAGVAVGSHPLSFPMVAAVIAALFVWPSEADAEPVARWLPNPASLRRGAWATLGATAILAPVAGLNLARFGSLNPVTYGPCVWRSCAETGLDRQGIVPMLHWSSPVLLWALATAVAWSLTRRSRAGTATVFALSIGAISPPSELHDRALAIAALAWAFVVDASRFALGYSYTRPRDGLGAFLGPFALKSMLQSAPAMLLATLAGAASARASTRRAVLLVALPCAALLGSLALRAIMPMAFALGYPFLAMRYAMPALPLLAALAVVATRSLPWRTTHLAAGALITAALVWWLCRWHDDLAYARRLVLLRGTLAVAAAAFVLLARSRAPRASAAWARAATAAATLAFAASLAVAIAVDLREAARNRDEGDRYAAAVARALPRRLALVGYPPELDPVLGLRATRDVEYFDLHETRDWVQVRAVIGGWWAQRRPVYVLMPVASPYASPMPDVRFARVDALRGVFVALPVVPSGDRAGP